LNFRIDLPMLEPVVPLLVAQIPDHVHNSGQRGDEDRRHAQRGVSGRTHITDIEPGSICDTNRFLGRRFDAETDPQDDGVGRVIDERREHPGEPRCVGVGGQR
jgi:hypothetical protein